MNYKEPATLFDTTALYLSNHTDVLQEAAPYLPEELHIQLGRLVLDKRIKASLVPLVIKEPQKYNSPKHQGVCALEGVPDTDQIISIACDGKIAFCHETNVPECVIKTPHLNPYSSCLQSKTNRFFVGSADGSITSWDYQKQTRIDDIAAHSAPVTSLALSAEQRYLISGSTNAAIKIWDTNTNKCITQLKGHAAAIRNAYFLAGEETAISAAYDGLIKMWDVNKEKEISSHKLTQDRISRMAILSDKAVACSHDTNKIALLDVRNKKTSHSFENGGDTIWALLAEQKGHHLVTGAWDGLIKVWDLRMLARAITIVAHADWVQSLSQLHGLKRIVSGSRDQTVKVWDISSIRALENMTLEKSISLVELLSQSKPATDEERLAFIRKHTHPSTQPSLLRSYGGQAERLLLSLTKGQDESPKLSTYVA